MIDRLYHLTDQSDHAAYHLDQVNMYTHCIIQVREGCRNPAFKYWVVKDIEILAIILVPLIMTLSRGHTGQIC